MPSPDPNDPGLLTPAETSLLIDRYELTMAASYLRRGMNQPSVFELFVRHLPPNRDWLLVAGLGPALELVRGLRFGERELSYLCSQGFDEDLLDYLSRFDFSGDIDAMPEGTVAFANEPLLRVTGPRIEAQILETLLLNQLNFQTAIATKAARIVLAIGGGLPGRGDRLVDFSARRDYGTDAAMKAARAAAIAGAEGTSNVAAAMRYGLHPVGTMAHSYVMSFADEETAFRAFLQDVPHSAILLVNTYDTLSGMRRAIAASRSTGVPLGGVRIDSGDLLALSREARKMLDDAGMAGARILASGDLDETKIAALVASGAPIDSWGVGTDLGTSRDSPTVAGVYKLVADAPRDAAEWRPVSKQSPGKGTIGWPKQVFRNERDGEMAGDVIAGHDEQLDGQPLLVPVMRGGEPVRRETLGQMRGRATAQLQALPEHLRATGVQGECRPYPVRYSARLDELASPEGASSSVASGS